MIKIKLGLKIFSLLLRTILNIIIDYIMKDVLKKFYKKIFKGIEIGLFVILFLSFTILCLLFYFHRFYSVPINNTNSVIVPFYLHHSLKENCFLFTGQNFSQKFIDNFCKYNLTTHLPHSPSNAVCYLFKFPKATVPSYFNVLQWGGNEHIGIGNYICRDKLNKITFYTPQEFKMEFHQNDYFLKN